MQKSTRSYQISGQRNQDSIIITLIIIDALFGVSFELTIKYPLS